MIIPTSPIKLPSSTTSKPWAVIIKSNPNQPRTTNQDGDYQIIIKSNPNQPKTKTETIKLRRLLLIWIQEEAQAIYIHSTSMIRPTNSVMQDNNTACILLQSGNRDAANHVLQRALHSLKKQIFKQRVDVKPPLRSPHGPFQSYAKERSRESSNMEDLSSDCDSHTVFEEQSKHIQSVPVAPLCPQSSSQPLSSIAMYNRAFILSQSDVEWKQLSQLDYQQWATSIIFYNLALVHHTQGVKQGLDRQSLATSLRFYELAANLLESITTSEEEDFNCLLLRCAIANNLGHVHACLHSTTPTREAFAHLQELLERLHLLSNQQRLTEEDHLLFFLNTMLQVNGLQVAPAA